MHDRGGTRSAHAHRRRTSQPAITRLPLPIFHRVQQSGRRTAGCPGFGHRGPTVEQFDGTGDAFA